MREPIVIELRPETAEGIRARASELRKDPDELAARILEEAFDALERQAVIRRVYQRKLLALLGE